MARKVPEAVPTICRETLAPAAQDRTPGYSRPKTKFRSIANGNPIEANNITLDGVSINSITWAGAAVITPNEESVKEMKIVTNDYDAEDGRSAAPRCRSSQKTAPTIGMAADSSALTAPA